MSTAYPARVVVIGAGNVGCGAVTPALLAAGLRPTLVTRTAAGAAALARGSVTISTGRPGPAAQLDLSSVPAVSMEDSEAVRRVVRHADLVVVAVGPGQAASAAPILAAGLSGRSPVDVLVCDNREAGASEMRALVAEHGDDSVLIHGYACVLVDRVVTRVEGDDGRRLFVAEPDGALYVDARGLRGPLPPIPGLRAVEDFHARFVRKLFLFSAGHAATAFLGDLRGHLTLEQSLRDQEVAVVVETAMRESQTALERRFGRRFAGGRRHVTDCLRRYADAHVADTVARVGRNPHRKLGPEDRICGPALLAHDLGLPAPALTVVAAAALVADARRTAEPTDAADRLSRHSGRPESHPFVSSAAEVANLLSAGMSPARALRDLTVTGPARSSLSLVSKGAAA